MSVCHFPGVVQGADAIEFHNVYKVCNLQEHPSLCNRIRACDSTVLLNMPATWVEEEGEGNEDLNRKHSHMHSECWLRASHAC